MAHILDPEKVMNSLQSGVVSSIGDFFPLVGDKQTLRAKKLYIGKEADIDDIKSQRRARMLGVTWAAPVYGDFELVDNASGKVIDSKNKLKLVNLPAITRRFSFIVGGREYQVDNQWRLKSGVYTRERADGDLETQFNLASGAGFRMLFDPTKKAFSMRYGTANIPLVSGLRALGVTDDEMKKEWGNDIFTAAGKAARPTDVIKLAKALDRYKTPANQAEAAEIVRAKYAETTLSPDTTKITLGRSVTTINGDSLLLASKKLLNVHRGVAQVDNRDSLQFKELWSVDDFIPERVKNSSSRINRKLKNNIDRRDNVRAIVGIDTFNMPVKAFFTSTALAQQSSQVNPLDMISSHMRTTLLGSGGISTTNAISFDAKLIDASHLGFLDPVATPEGERTGITLHLGLGVTKEGKEATIPLWDTKANKVVTRNPAELATANVAFPDQYSWSGGVPTPRTPTITASNSSVGDPRTVKAKDVDYILTSTKGMFSLTANLIPFLASDQANRAEMATRHMEQSISLKHREQPLVQTLTGDHNSETTWESVVGKFTSHKSPISGKVVAVDDDHVSVEGANGKVEKISIYNNFPLNDKKGFIDANPVVKVGDVVKKNQLVADSTYTKNGVLAMGTNLKIAYLPYKGLVFEDGIVISESASDKLTSEHLYKERTYVDRDMTLGLKKFRANYPGVVTDANAKKLDDDGVIKKGERVNPGDVITTALRKTEPSREQMFLKGIHRSLVRPYKDMSLTWDHGGPGIVTDVVKNRSEVTVYVRTEEAADIGDKLCYAEGHEVLTSSGWCGVGSLRVGDMVASLNPVTDEIEYVGVANVHAFECDDEPIYSLDTTQVSMAVTLGHKLYAGDRSGADYKLTPAREMMGKRYRLKMDGSWVGTDMETFEFPSMEVAAGQFGNGSRTIPPIKMPIDRYMFLLGIYISEGHCYGKGGSYYIELTQIKQPNRDQLRQKLIDEEFKFTETEDKFRIYSKQLYTYFSEFGKSYEKYLPEWVFSLPPERLGVLYEWLMFGDGNRTGSGHAYCTTSYRLAGEFQRLLLHIGFGSRIATKQAYTTNILGGTYNCRECYYVRVLRTKTRPTINHGHAKRQGGQEERIERYTGTVYCPTLERNHVLFTRRNGKVHWSGNSGRHGNKGVITAVLPDEEMPRDKDGNAMEIIVNPSGVPGRINVGQVMETGLGKVAAKLGHPLAVNNFESDDQRKIIKVKGHFRTVDTAEGEKKIWIDAYEYERGYQEVVASIMEAEDVSATDELFDAETGKSLGQVMVGSQYVLKLVHQVDKKISARSHGYGHDYDSSMIPKGGGDAGGQKFGGLGLFALLAHGATANIQDGQTFKSDKSQDDVWLAIQAGEPLPAPKPSFAYTKFLSYLNALGVNVDKEGSTLTLSPLTDKQVLELSNGELTKATRVLRGKDLKPEEGGLFDESITGGPGGDRWSHIVLASSLPNPMFEKPILSLLGITGKDYDGIIKGDKRLKDGGVVDNSRGSVSGVASLVAALAAINIDKELESAHETVKTARRGDLDRANKRVKYLTMLKREGLTADDAYVLSNLPVLPPLFRPITAMEGGDLNVDGLNLLYRDIALLNTKLKDSEGVLPEADLAKSRSDLYDAISALMATSGASGDSGMTSDGTLRPPGILTMIAGATSPKYGYFHQRVMDRKQDLSMRSVIVPDMELHLDEIGLPRKGAMKIFRPFVVKEMVRMGYTPLSARDEIEKGSKLSDRALEVAVAKRPVLFKRDPVLHKFGIMGFKVKLHDETAIHIHPLVTGGFGADFDGDDQINTVLLAVAEETFKAHNDIWKPREVQMSARFKEIVGVYDKDMRFCVCNLEDVPHGELLGSKNGVDFYAVDQWLYVVAMDETTGEPTLADIGGWSIHKDKEVELVTLGSGRQIITDDDPRAVYGILPETLTWERRRPSDAKGLFVPVITPTEDMFIPDAQLIIEMGDVKVLDKDAGLGYFFGATIGDGWVSHDHEAPQSVCLASIHDEIGEAWSHEVNRILGDTHISTIFNPAGEGTGKYEGSSGSRKWTKTNKVFGEWLAPLIGRGSGNKQLPPFALSSPKEFKLGLLAGLLDTDGSVSVLHGKAKPQFSIQYTTTSIRLAQEIQALSRSIGVTASLCGYKSPTGTPAWQIVFSTPEMHAIGPLPLKHPVKAKIHAEFLAAPAPDKRMAYSRFRLCPIPVGLATELMGLIGHKSHYTLYTTLSKAKKCGYTSKVAAIDVLRIVEDSGKSVLHPLFTKWASIVNAPTHFEKVVGVEKTGIRETGYDLTVPGFETFMSTDGVILSNTMAVFVPVSQKAVDEAYNMMPSKNLFNPATGRVMYQPSLEGQLGLFLLTQPGKATDHKYDSVESAIDAAKSGAISYTDVIAVGDKKTTAGKAAFYKALPPKVREDKYLTDMSMIMNGNNLQAALRDVALKEPAAFQQSADALKTLGFTHAYDIGFSFKGDDFKALRTLRQRHVALAEAKVAKLGDVKQSVRDAAIIDIYTQTTKDMAAEAKKELSTSGSALFSMYAAGVKPSWVQLQQILLAPMLLQNARGETIPVPVTRSYSEGLDTAGYWVASSGARKGLIEKVQSVAKPGALSKQIMNTVISYVVTADDCGTDRGISLDSSDANMVDRYLAKSVDLPNRTLKAGDLVTPGVATEIRTAKIGKVQVRSPLKCMAPKGMCAKCYGSYESGVRPPIGTNLGAIAGQSLGERTVQISMKTFHLGGVAGANSAVVSSMDRLTQLLKLPQKLPNAAALAPANATVGKITKSSAGGHDMEIGGSSVYIPGNRSLLVKKGDQVKKGQQVSSGPIDPRQLLELTNIDTVQRYISSEIFDLFESEGVRKRNIEVVTKALTNLGVVTDAGDSESHIRGDWVPLNYAADANKSLGKPMVVEPSMRGIETLALDQTTDWIARMQYRKLKETLTRGVSEGWKSDIHGLHPAPAVVYSAELNKPRVGGNY